MKNLILVFVLVFTPVLWAAFPPPIQSNYFTTNKVPIMYGSNVVGSVSEAAHATNADTAVTSTYVTTTPLTNGVYGSNVVGLVLNQWDTNAVPRDASSLTNLVPQGFASTNSLDIGWTGNWRFPIGLMISTTRTFGVTTNGAFTVDSGLSIDNFNYDETSIGGTGITGLTFSNLFAVSGGSLQSGGASPGDFTLGTVAGLTNLSAPNLKYINGNFTVGNGCTNLATLSFPNLTYLGGRINPNVNLRSWSSPNLKFYGQIAGQEEFSTVPQLTNLDLSSAIIAFGLWFGTTGPTNLPYLSLPKLQRTFVDFRPASLSNTFGIDLSSWYFGGGVCTIQKCTVLTNISLPSLAYLNGAVTVSSCPAVTNFSMPAIVNMNGGVTMSTGNGNLTTVTIGTAGTTLRINGNVTITNQKLNQASVDGILCLLAGLDGTGGTTAYSSKTVNLSGGTSSAPSLAGTNCVTTLTGRGCTVTTNH